MDQKLQSVIEKVNKLLALTTSTNAHEAANAAAQANRLIDKFRISEEELAAPVEEPIIEDSNFIYETGRVTPWKSTLAVILAHHYGCAIFNAADYSTGRLVTRYKLVGRDSDIYISKYMFGWLVSECQRLSDTNAKGKGHIFANSYCIGFVTGVKDQLTDSRKQLQSAESSVALVKIEGRLEESTRTMRQLHSLKKVNKSGGSRIVGDAFSAGLQQGRNININTAPNKMLGT